MKLIKDWKAFCRYLTFVETAELTHLLVLRDYSWQTNIAVIFFLFLLSITADYGWRD